MQQQQQVEADDRVVLFYSRTCVYCIKLLNALQKHPRVNDLVQKACIEQNGVPRGVSALPAIIVNNNQLYQAKDAFEWLKTKKNKTGFVELGTDTNANFSLFSEKSGHQKDPMMNKDINIGSAKFISQDPNRIAPEPNQKINGKRFDQRQLQQRQNHAVQVQRYTGQGTPPMLQSQQIQSNGFDENAYMARLNEKVTIPARQPNNNRNGGGNAMNLPPELQPQKFDSNKNQGVMQQKLDQLLQSRGYQQQLPNDGFRRF